MIKPDRRQLSTNSCRLGCKNESLLYLYILNYEYYLSQRNFFLLCFGVWILLFVCNESLFVSTHARWRFSKQPIGSLLNRSILSIMVLEKSIGIFKHTSIYHTGIGKLAYNSSCSGVCVCVFIWACYHHSTLTFPSQEKQLTFVKTSLNESIFCLQRK